MAIGGHQIRSDDCTHLILIVSSRLVSHRILSHLIISHTDLIIPYLISSLSYRTVSHTHLNRTVSDLTTGAQLWVEPKAYDAQRQPPPPIDVPAGTRGLNPYQRSVVRSTPEAHTQMHTYAHLPMCMHAFNAPAESWCIVYVMIQVPCWMVRCLLTYSLTYLPAADDASAVPPDGRRGRPRSPPAKLGPHAKLGSQRLGSMRVASDPG